ncbi:MAG TPA: tRNA lysidine(34) synthetase TilS [Solirubrobacteraceae bacterium]|nr:tRNA lysidine(34) synthetase TilS [Solirubrobacteraceae bacterium]
MTLPSPAEIEHRVRASGLLAAGGSVVVLLSGGRDSTCLLDLAVAIAGRESVTGLHLNYGLRDGADADEHHCAELCSRLGVLLEVRRPRRPERGNLQAWARDERYGAAAQIALARGGDVAAGHTATDQVETILYRLASSPSRRALLGMRAREGLLVRPLLEFTREQTAAYCTARGLTWREDESNDSDAYARNRIRAQLMPALEAVHPGAADNVIAVAEILREEAAVLDALVDEVLERRDRVALSRLRELGPALARLVVQRLADDAADGVAPGVARRASEIVALDEHGTMQLDTGGGVVAIAEYGVLRFESRASPSAGTTPEPVLLPIPGSAVFGEQEITCELGPPAREPGVVDRAGLGDDLLVRSWRPGDRIAPLGLQGSKSLQDLFTARRVPRRERAAVPVVESQGEIVWVAGVATSERFKVTDSTAEAVRLGVRPGRPPRS